MSYEVIEVDAMLLDWSGETCKRGPRLVVELLDESQLEPFKNKTLKKGKTAGQMFKVVFVEVDGNGEPVEPEAPRASTGKFPGGLCGLAVRWCEEDEFRRWLYTLYPNTLNDVVKRQGVRGTPKVNAECVKLICDVRSRKELDTDDRAAYVFNQKIREPYAAHRKEIGLE